MSLNDVKIQIEEVNKSQIIEQSRNADTYDSRYSEFYLNLSGESLHRVLKPMKDGLILDIATGTGRSLIALGKRGYNVIGVDITMAMLAIAQKRVEELQIQSISLTQGDAINLPFKDESFDAVVCTRFLHIMPYETQRFFIDEMGRVLKPNGLLICEFYSPFWGGFLWWTPLGRRYPKRYTWPSQIKELFRGYKIQKSIGLGLPGMSFISRKVDHKLAISASRWLNIFPIKHISYQILIVAKKSLNLAGIYTS